jgi:pimeloyl-ACP methyl ester carboxylesterase
MRIVWTALLGGALGLGGTAAAASSGAPLPLEECRLEHPLHLTSVAARCGIVTVPEDPSHPEGAAISLRVAVVPALNRRAAAAPLFVLAGGPGQSATDLYASYAGAFARANRNHDIVLLDQRGTGRSAPLQCPYPDDWRSAPDELPLLRQATLACLEKLGPRVRFYTSSVAVADLDTVRAALGYARIDLYGSSYGTRVAQLYMRRHPQSTHAVVLDGVTYPEQAIGPDTPSDGERALDLIVARCERSPDCVAAYPALRSELDGLRRRFGPDMVELTLNDPGSGRPLRIDFGRAMFNAALRFLSYSATEASLLPTLLHEGASGNLGPLAAQTILLARQVGDQIATGMQNSVICSEDEPYFAAAAIDRQLIAKTYQGTDQLDAVAEICKLWPRGPVDPDLHSALQSDIPTLLLSGEADPVTPPADAERAARGLTHHRELVLPGEGHGQLATGCVPKLIAEFLDDPAPAALDAVCLGSHRPAPFFVSFTGPAP